MGDSANNQGNNHIDFVYDGDTAITNFAGERRHIKFGPASETDGQDGTYKYNGILTCLKPDAKLYSFSILIDDNDDILSSFIKTLSKSNDIKFVNKQINNKHIYNFTNSNEYLGKFSSISDGTEDNYMLIIGHLQNGIQKLYVKKIILIINNPYANSFDIGGYKRDNDLLTAEEYLNLYYIEHFSLNIPKFISDKYTPYKIIIEEEKSTSPRTGETADRESEVTQPDSGDLKEAIGAADGLSEEVIEGEVNKFTDVEGADEITDVSVTVEKKDKVPDAQGGGKKLASKVKKNKKNKVV